MGDMADYMLDMYLSDPFYDYDGYTEELTCKYCGADNVEWKKEKGRWFLVDNNGSRHICNPFKCEVD